MNQFYQKGGENLSLALKLAGLTFTRFPNANFSLEGLHLFM
jgi:hypothetical protein